MADNSYHIFQKRISYQGDLIILLKQVCSDLKLGKFLEHNIVPFGYEDLNIFLSTDQGKFFIKIFAKTRTGQDCQRYIDIVTHVLTAGVKHPKLFSLNQNFLYETVIDDQQIKLCVQEYIEGQTFYQMKRKPDQNEVNEIIRQAALINKMDFRPGDIYDSWAVVNFLPEYQKIKKYLSNEELELLQPIAIEFEKIDQNKLPHCFVHGDIIETNVIKTSANDLFIVDFSVSNYYPRIVEVTMLLCNLFFDHLSSTENFLQIYNSVIDKYTQFIKFSEEELVILPVFLKAAHAMQLIGAKQTRISDGDSVENDHWLKVGREGLEFCNQIWF
jgi:Ser/Thr protein kinase RdoA (MazF antagonist)